MFDKLKSAWKRLIDSQAQSNQKPRAAANYSGMGSQNPFNQLTAGEKWVNGISGNGIPTTIEVSKTLQNARSASHQSPQTRALLTRARDITVDTGLRVEPMPAWEQLGITDDDFKERWVAENGQRFDMYMQSKQCHRSGTMTGYQIQRLWKTSDERDNDQFGRFFYSRDQQLMSPVQLELIDPTLIRGCPTVSSYGVQNWNDGIGRDAQGREIAYSIYDRVKENGYWVTKLKEIPAKGPRSGRIFMFHGFEQEYCGQGRGFSKLHPVLQDYQSIVDYVSAVVQKAINQNDIVGFIKPSDIAPASNPFEGQQGGPDIYNDIAILSDDESEEFCFYRPEYTKRVPGSDFYANLKAGEEITFPKETAPSTEFDKFVTSICKYAYAVTGWPIEVILMAFNSNYSASRAALLEAWRTGRISQMNIKGDLMDVWWEMWLSEEIAAGRTVAPGWQDPRLKQAWMRYRLQGPPLPSISPRDDIAAAETKLKLSLSTQEREAYAINGSNARQNIAENKKWFAESPTAFWEDKPVDGQTPTPGK